MVLTSFGPTHNIVVRLPTDAEIGDVVEVYRDPASPSDAPFVFPNVGESIGDKPVSDGSNVTAGVGVSTLSGVVFRKVSSTLWMPIGAA
jgi:hypothetical protein